nr:ABC transporter permease [Bradyrhizobium neotropicale]
MAAGRDNIWSRLLGGMQVLFATLPPYWLATILLVVFAIELRIFPVAGGDSPIALVLPTLALALELSGFFGQVVISEFSCVLEQPFVTSARMRGMSDLGVRFRHVLRHAALPGITLSGWALGKLLSGAVLVEAVFARQGLGGVLVTATSTRDVPVVSGVILVSAGLFVLTSTVVDLAYGIVDPRIKLT